MDISIRKEGTLIEGFKPEYHWCKGHRGSCPEPPGPEPPGPDTGDTGITWIKILVADSITDKGVAGFEFSPSSAETSVFYTSSDPDTASIHPYTGNITVLQDGVVTFCVIDILTGLQDCKEVDVYKSEPGPEPPVTGDTGITSIEIIVADTITDEGIATYRFEPVTADTSIVFSSSDPDYAIIDEDTGEIEVYDTGFVTFCVEDLLTQLKDCKTVYVIKTEPGPEPPTGTCVIRVTYNVTTIGATYVLGRNSSAIVKMESDEGVVKTGSHMLWMFKKTGIHTIDITFNSTKLDDHLFIDEVSNRESKVPITGIIIPDCITEIGEGVFWECRQLKNVVLPSYLVAVDDYAFYMCISIEQLSLPNTLKTIGLAAFSWTRLHTITIPASVDSILPEAFSMCSSLETVNMLCSIPTTTEEEREEWWGMFDYCPLLRNFAGPNASSDGKMLVTNDNIAIAFAPYGITDYSIPSGVRRIATYCFREINTLESVTIPDSVKSIGDKAFINSAFIETITFGSGLETIGSEAFSYVTSLDYIYSYATIAPSVVSNSFFNAGVYGEHRILYYPAGSDYSSWLNYRISGLPSTWTGQEINDI